MKFFCFVVPVFLLTFGDVVAEIEEASKLEKRGLTLYIKQMLTTSALT
jgi:hypothetical protein